MRCSLVAFVACLFCANLAHAQWGDLKGRITLNGKTPAAKVLVAGPVPGFPVANIPDESLVVVGKSKGIANVVVWLAKPPAQIHPAFANLQPPAVTLSQTAGVYLPHVMVMQTSQTLNLVNANPVVSSFKAVPWKNQGYNHTLLPATLVPVTFKRAEKLPFQFTSDLHPAYVLVVDYPYATITNTNGDFVIKNLSTGEHEFKVWHENAGYLVTDPKDSKKGLIATIEDGQEFDAPEIFVPFEKVQPK